MNLTEATMLALQGKLNLNENKSVKAESRHLLPSQKKLIKQFIKDTNAGKEPEWYDLMKRLEELNDYETLNQDAKRYKNDIELNESKKIEETENTNVEELLDLLDFIDITDNQEEFCDFTGISEAQLDGSQGFNEEDAKEFLPRVKEWMSNQKIKKTESIDINVDDSTTVSVDDTQTIVNTEDASIIIQEETPNTIEVPVESDDTIIPETEPEATDIVDTDTNNTIIDTDTVDVPVEEPSSDVEELSTPEEDLDLPASEPTETEIEETDNVEESKEIKQEAPRKTRDVYVLMGNYGYGWDELVTYDNYSDAKADYKIYEENEPENQHKIVRKREPIEESKKTESVVSDAANSIDYNHKQNPSESNAIPFFAGVISDIAEDMGDDYSEWLSEDIVREIIDTLFDNDQLWSTITGIVKDAITTKVEEIRGVPGEEIEESKPVIKKFSSKSFNEALTKYFKKIDKTVESVTETKIRKSNKAIKIETKLIKTDKTSETIKLEMKHVESNGDFSRYNLVENTSLKTESKHGTVSMLLHTNKQQVLECRYIISK